MSHGLVQMNEDMSHTDNVDLRVHRVRRTNQTHTFYWSQWRKFDSCDEL